MGFFGFLLRRLARYRPAWEYLYITDRDETEWFDALSEYCAAAGFKVTYIDAPLYKAVYRLDHEIKQSRRNLQRKTRLMAIRSTVASLLSHHHGSENYFYLIGILRNRREPGLEPEVMARIKEQIEYILKSAPHLHLQEITEMERM